MRGRWRKTKFLVGLLLLPLCAALTLTLWRVLRILAEAPARLPWLHVSATVAGIAIWALVWIFLPRMTRTYVLGHELTHAFWTLLFGGRASDLRVTERGGSVRVTKSNVWVTLAPYFFPFYAILVAIVWCLLRAFWPAVRPYDPTRPLLARPRLGLPRHLHPPLPPRRTARRLRARPPLLLRPHLPPQRRHPRRRPRPPLPLDLSRRRRRPPPAPPRLLFRRRHLPPVAHHQIARVLSPQPPPVAPRGLRPASKRPPMG